jgi:hypothetical protein
MKYTKYIVFTLVTSSVLLLGGCKKFLDINDNPNIVKDPGVENVLPSAQVEIAHVLGNLFQVNGSFWAQYWTQSPLANQYKQYDQYQPTTDNYNRPWGTFYDGALSDLKYIYNTANEKSNKNYMAISKLLMAYTFQVITDAWGDVPYSEALKGLDGDGGIVSPKFDAQASIYDSLVVLVNEGISLIDVNSPVHPGADDLMYGGDMEKWLKFANTLKLKIGLRLSEVNAGKAENIIRSIDSNAVFIEMGDDALITYTTAGGSQNPLYSEMVGLNRTQNLYASSTCVDSMNANFDPRVFVFYKPLGNGTVVGNKQGDFNSSTAATGKSIVSANVAGEASNDASATAPVRFLSASESYLLQAEAVARGWWNGDDEGLFKSGIEASFDAYGITDPTEIAYYNDSTYWGVYPTAGSMPDRVRHIVTQKWFSMCGNQGFEAWTEQRRTGYPDFLVQSVNSLIGAKKPARFVYPTNEINLNANFPGLKSVDQRVWWDIN